VLRIRDVYPGSQISDPDFYPSRIQKLQQERGEKKFVFIPFYVPQILVWDPGSEIRDPEKSDPESRGQKGTGSRIRNTAFRECWDEIVHTLLCHPIVFSGFIDWLIGQLGNVGMRLSLSPSLPSNAFLVLLID
jgi:hypothetical protein